MTELRTGRFTDLLPEHLRSLETEALAYAVGRQVERLLGWADGVPFYACLSSAPEAVLDLLAVELRAPAYSDALPLEIKRSLIRDALMAYAKMGTPAAVERTLSAIFGDGRVEEWFDYSGEPHHFRAVIPAGDGVALEGLEAFRRSLDSVKRLSSWLDGLDIEMEQDAALNLGTFTELANTLEVWPLVVNDLESAGSLDAVGVLEYHRNLELWPLEIENMKEETA